MSVRSGVDKVTGWGRVVHDNVNMLTYHLPVNMFVCSTYLIVMLLLAPVMMFLDTESTIALHLPLG
jgi:hypothetical protein